MITHGPERLAGQGLDPQQYDSGNRAIHALLAADGVGEQVDLVLTWRGSSPSDGAYEAWAQRGMVRFRRLIDADGGLHFEVLDVVDVVVSKLKRFSASDADDVRAMTESGLVEHRRLIERFRSAVDVYGGDARADDLPKYVKNLHRVERDHLGVPETEIELPAWVLED